MASSFVAGLAAGCCFDRCNRVCRAAARRRRPAAVSARLPRHRMVRLVALAGRALAGCARSILFRSDIAAACGRFGGFDPGSLMIAGPFLALLAPLPEFREFAVQGRPPVKGLVPIIVFGVCTLDCVLITVAQGQWSERAGALQWFAPVIYAVALFRRAPMAKQILHEAAGAFSVILPITGLYGIYQYTDPRCGTATG